MAKLPDSGLGYVPLQGRNEELRSQLKMLAVRTQLLLGIAKEFGASILNPAVLLDLIARRLVDAVGDLAMIRLASDDGEWLEASSVAWHPDPEVRAAALRTLSSRISVDEGAMGQVFLSRLPKRIQAADPDTLGLHSMVVLPLLLGDRALGVACVGRIAPGRLYTKDDLDLLQDIASQAGLAVANSQLLSRFRTG